MDSPLSSLLAARAAQRKATALDLARRVIERASSLGVTLVVGGSLARDRMLPHSDVDFIILDEGGLSYGRVFAEVEEVMGRFPFDLIRLADMPWPAQIRMMEKTLDASALREAHG